MGVWSRSFKADKQKWTSFRRETLAVQQALRYFHDDIAGRHVTVYSDCKALVHAFKSPTSQDYDPLAKAHLVEIGQWTRDIEHIEAKKNQMADFFSRSYGNKIGRAYSHLSEDETTVVSPISLSALEEVSLQTLSPKALAESQALCPIIKCHKEGNAPKSVKMGYHTIDGYSIYCEVTNDPRPMIPTELREVIMQTFHALGHPNAKETGRRISEFYYWPHLKKEVEKYVQLCHPCQAVKRVESTLNWVNFRHRTRGSPICMWTSWGPSQKAEDTNIS